VAIGGLTPLMKMLLDRELLHGDCLTVTGRTVAENLAGVKPYPAGQDIIRGFDNPIKPTSHLVIMYGNLAPMGGVAKISGKEGERFTGTARVFDSEEATNKAILAGKIRKGDVVVIRYEGPKGGPGMREMLSPTSMLMGRGLGKEVALITDGRFSGGTHGFVPSRWCRTATASPSTPSRASSPSTSPPANSPPAARPSGPAPPSTPAASSPSTPTTSARRTSGRLRMGIRRPKCCRKQNGWWSIPRKRSTQKRGGKVPM
jgi:hypothetical protein